MKTEQKIKISHDSITNRVDIQTAYISAKLMEADPDAYSRISTAATDSVFLVPAMEVARTNILAATRRYATSINAVAGDNTEYEIIRLYTPGNFDTTQLSGLTNALQKYYVSYVLYKWLLVTQPNIAEIYGKEAEQQLAMARILLAKRTPPTYTSPLTIIETDNG